MDARTLRNQGVSLAKKGRKKEARSLLEQAIALDRDDPDAWAWLALTSEGKQAQVAALQQALERDPTHGAALAVAKHLRISEAELIVLPEDKYNEAAHDRPVGTQAVLVMNAPAQSPPPPPAEAPAPPAPVRRPPIAPIRVDIDAKYLMIPRVCVCCGGSPQAERMYSAKKTHGKMVTTRLKRAQTRSWAFPFCAACVAHHGAWNAYTAVRNRVLLFALLAAGLLCAAALFRPLILAGACGLLTALGMAALKLPKLRRASDAALLAACAHPGPEVVTFVGWQGTLQSFSFRSPYALEMMRVNRSKLVNVPEELAQRLQRPPEVQESTQSAS